MKEINCIQYSPEWWEARRGIPTASEFSKIITSKGDLSKSADKYIARLVAERITLNPNFFTEREGHTPAMRNGIALEPEARNWVAMEAGKPVRKVGFFTTDDGKYGASPDGMIGDDEFLELKCPQLDTHLAWAMKGVLPREHRLQPRGQLCVGKDNGGPIKRTRWVSYSPPAEPLQFIIEPDELTEKVEVAVRQFCDRLDEAVAKLVTQQGDSIRTPPAVQVEIEAELKTWQDRLSAYDSLDLMEVCQGVNQMLPSLKDVKPVAKRACWDWTLSRMAECGCEWNRQFKTFAPKEQVFQ